MSSFLKCQLCPPCRPLEHLLSIQTHESIKVSFTEFHWNRRNTSLNLGHAIQCGLLWVCTKVHINIFASFHSWSYGIMLVLIAFSANHTTIPLVMKLFHAISWYRRWTGGEHNTWKLLPVTPCLILKLGLNWELYSESLVFGVKLVPGDPLDTNFCGSGKPSKDLQNTSRSA